MLHHRKLSTSRDQMDVNRKNLYSHINDGPIRQHHNNIGVAVPVINNAVSNTTSNTVSNAVDHAPVVRTHDYTLTND